MWIYETNNWTKLVWDKDSVSDRLMAVNKKVGFLSGRLSALVGGAEVGR
jgi:hypothetical protein